MNLYLVIYNFDNMESIRLEIIAKDQQSATNKAWRTLPQSAIDHYSGERVELLQKNRVK